MSVPTEQGLPRDSPPTRSLRDSSSPKKPETGFFKPPVRTGPSYYEKLPRSHPVPDQVPHLSPGAHQPHVLHDCYNPEPLSSPAIQASGSPSTMMANHNNPHYYPGFYERVPRDHLREEDNGTTIEPSLSYDQPAPQAVSSYSQALSSGQPSHLVNNPNNRHMVAHYGQNASAMSVPRPGSGASHNYPDPSTHTSILSGVPKSSSDVNVNHPNTVEANHNICGRQRLPPSPTATESSLGPDNSVRTEYGWHVTQQFLRDGNVVTRNGDIPGIGHKFLPNNITPISYEEPVPDLPNVPASRLRFGRRVRRQMFLAGELYKAGVVGPFMIERQWVMEFNRQEYHRIIGTLKIQDGEPVWLNRYEQPIGYWGNLPLVDMKELVDECLGRMGRKQWVDSTAPPPQLPEEYYDSDPGARAEEDEEEDEEEGEDEYGDSNSQ
ncbi:hypothetical protein F4775DRAFT_604911 [Biscogniauxia sp. FL1348]|nr:hypothetical protein F4775DRAFT_604911 [Biscogniauxia sp. FL1348]